MSSTNPVRPSAKHNANDERHALLFFGMDGVRPDALLAANAPTLKSLFFNPRTLYSFHLDVGNIPISTPSWISILKGVENLQHTIKNNTIDESHKKFPTLFQIVAEEGDKEGSASFGSSACFVGNWEGMLDILGEPTQRHSVSFSKNDEGAVAKLIEFLGSEAANNTDAIFLFLDDADEAGHKYGHAPHVSEYIAAIEEMDRRIKRVIDALKKRSTEPTQQCKKKSWMLSFMSDHGGTSAKDMSQPCLDSYEAILGRGSASKCIGLHGLGTLPQHRHALCLLHWPDLQSPSALQGRREVVPAPSTIDVFATMVDWLGVTLPEHGRGVSLLSRTQTIHMKSML